MNQLERRRVILTALGMVALAGCTYVLAQPPAVPATASCPAGRAVKWLVPGGPVAPRGWCAAVGPPVYASAPAAAANRADSVLVVTWNVHVGGGQIRRLIDDLRSGALTGGIPVGHFVLLLQEAHRGDDEVPPYVEGQLGARRATPGGPHRSSALDEARARGLHLLYVPSMRNGVQGGDRAEDKGNAIVSTLPLEHPSAVELPYQVQRRVAVLATIRPVSATGRGWPLLVASVHLDLRSRPGRIWASLGNGRLRQARGLVDALPAGVPALIAGDLNTWAGGAAEPAPRYLRTSFPNGSGRMARTFAGPLGTGGQLDHIFVRGMPAAPAWRAAERYGSDHYPVMTWVWPGSENGREQPGGALQQPLARAAPSEGE